MAVGPEAAKLIAGLLAAAVRGVFVSTGNDVELAAETATRTNAPTAEPRGGRAVTAYGTTTWIVFDASAPSAYLTVSVTSNVPARR